MQLPRITNDTNIRFAFFGSSRFSVIVLDELEKVGILPACIITTPDKPKGRNLVLSPTPVKEWALDKGIPVHDPAVLDTAFSDMLTSETKEKGYQTFVVASYGKIIPATIIDIPPHKTLNIHPSLLPAYRGASPLQSAMLDDAKQTGVTIMRIDEKMDHGPVIAQQKITVDEWPSYSKFEEMMAGHGARLLASTMPAWIAGTLTEHEQDHSTATFTRKIAKEDGLIDLSADDHANFRKIQAHCEWPGTYFFVNKNNKKIRIKIARASYTEGKLSIERVIPEGKPEMDYADFLRGYDNPYLVES